MTTWAPTLEQARRAAALGDWFLHHVPPIFNLDADARRTWHWLAMGDPESVSARAPGVAATREALSAAFPDEVLQRALADFLCFPLATALVADTPPQTERTPDEWVRFNVHLLACDAAVAYAREHPSPYMIRLVGARLEYMLTHVVHGTERAHLYYMHLPQQYFPLQSRACIELLLEWSDDGEARRLLCDLITGVWRVPVSIPEEERFEPKPTNSYQAHNTALHSPERFWPLLERDARLDYPAFRAAVEMFSPAWPLLPLQLLWKPAAPAANELDRKLRGFGQRYLRELAGDLRNCTVSVWNGENTNLCGVEWLLHGCDHVERDDLQLVVGTYGNPSWMVRSLVSISGLDTDDTAEGAVARLRGYSTRTLKSVLPHAARVSALLLEALGWDDLVPLDRFVRDAARRGYEGRSDAPNCADPESGVIDREEVIAAIARAGESLAREYVELLTASRVPMGNTLTLVSAAMGWNAPSVLEGIGRDRQIAIKAFGLLPLTGGEHEVLERYRVLKQIDRDARAYGPDRVLNTRAAVEAGLANLAQTAGFPGAMHMEWALEARLATAARPMTAPRRIGEWEAQLLVGAVPRIVVRRGGRELKSVPAAVRRHEDFAELKEALGDLQFQARRLRTSLEDVMACGGTLTAADVSQVARTPAGAHLLEALVLRDADGRYGRYREEDQTCEALDGTPFVPAAPVLIAHPLHFARDGCLAAWQREVVRRRVTQPFKQVFRELYTPTADERDLPFTARFAGRQVDSGRATRLFGTRRWQVRGSDIPEPQKWFPTLRIRARVSFPDARHYLAAMDVITADRVTFEKDHRPLPLSEVPPAVFSEVLRDADLVVSAAAVTPDGAWSTEAAERRADVARTIAAEFGVSNVEFHGRFAHVTGTRANYRIHLGSGVVHLDPGPQVVPIPSSAAAGTATAFLPFAPDEDVKTAEIVGLILLFANDDKITDPSLLAQLP